jgi:hypothetical protein
MYDASRTDHLTVALRELDAAKALVDARKAELDEAVPIVTPLGCSAKALQNFEAKAHIMNKATRRYLGAVAAFNVACRKNSDYEPAESLPQETAEVG